MCFTCGITVALYPGEAFMPTRCPICASVLVSGLEPSDDNDALDALTERWWKLVNSRYERNGYFI